LERGTVSEFGDRFVSHPVAKKKNSLMRFHDVVIVSQTRAIVSMLTVRVKALLGFSRKAQPRRARSFQLGLRI
nr:hypothetical protein [Kiritimatiellia bacterium]